MSASLDASSHHVEDDAARRRALDVGRSFLVQAPAGSGKTELLIQRMLALLGIVERPERVVAITFTRKAAGEMRDRVVRALVEAADESIDAASLPPHARTTRELARRALAQDARHEWRLALHPSRLAIQTIDALAQGIALQAPLASGLPPAPRFAEDARPMYVAAARAAIAAADADDPHWRRLLNHQDNDANALAAMLAEMLGKRDQWRSLVVGGGGDMRATLEATLVREIEGELAGIARILDGADLAPLAPFATSALPRLDDSHDTLRRAFVDVAASGGAPPVDLAHLDAWRAIATWLQTAKVELRRKATGMAGVPLIGDGPGQAERRAVAKAIEQWLASLAAVPGLEAALASLVGLPPPHYPDDDWETIAALNAVLPRVAAELETTFATERQIDFPRATLGALAALGEGDAPSELLLRLDMRIEHLLVDEFQDTSYAHLELIRKLVSGWSEGDGRTLFAVGDPMQSIYRFRGAEVRAFLEAQLAGVVEGIEVEALTLRRNFRSHAGLVDWVNATFPAVLGPASDPWQGRVAFAAAVAARDRVDGPDTVIEVVATREEEAARIVEQVREALAAGGDVAILARARSHLAELLPALRAASIPYAAVDVDALGDRTAVRDIVALAHALVQPADRLAWLAVLRAPWCGLSLADLDALVVAADRSTASLDDLAVDPPTGVSRDGAARLANVATVIHDARRTRGRAPLAERLRAAWLALGGPATFDDTLDLVAVDDVLDLVAEHERAGDIPDWNAFVATLAGRKVAPPPDARPRVQVMTMHKAKGLEFDTVILPGLERGPGRHDSDLLRWRTRRTGLIVGIAKARGGEHGGVYAYLRDLAKLEEGAELARLAYVAVTRARRRLVLTAVVEPADRDESEGRSARASILGLIDHAAKERIVSSTGSGADDDAVEASRTIDRLPTGWRAPASSPALVVDAPVATVDAAPPFDWVRERARRLGVVVHALLAQVATDGLGAWDDAKLAAQLPRVRAQLIAEGAMPSDADAEAADVVATIASTVRDDRGRWLFDPAHSDARSEWALTGIDGDELVHVVLDRTFVADGVRWIVDFKTGAHEGADPTGFLDAEAQRYRPQLERYARIVAALDPSHPVRLALYHPRVPAGWRVLG